MAIISRSKWGARHPDGFRDAPLPAAEVWLHHSVTLAPDLQWVDADGDNVDDDEERAMRTLEDIGQSRFGGGISYTWLIMPSGRIYQGHSVDRQGAHTGGRNDIARAICLVGNYEDRAPTTAQLDAAAWLLRYAKSKGWIKYARLNGGHRDLKSTACPGAKAYAQIAEINRRAAAIEEDPLSEQGDYIVKLLQETTILVREIDQRVERIEKGGLAVSDSDGIFHKVTEQATYTVGQDADGTPVLKSVPVAKAVGYNRADIRAMREQLDRIEAALGGQS